MVFANVQSSPKSTKTKYEEKLQKHFLIAPLIVQICTMI